MCVGFKLNKRINQKQKYWFHQASASTYVSGVDLAAGGIFLYSAYVRGISFKNDFELNKHLCVEMCGIPHLGPNAHHIRVCVLILTYDINITY